MGKPCGRCEADNQSAMHPFTQYKQWMIERYGAPLFRIPVRIASSCPHGRCAFCPDGGGKAQQTQKQESPLDQAAAAVQFAKRRYRAKKFMLYIQAFTADLTDSAQQQTIRELLDRFDFDAVSIGTRPDCLPDEALDFLESLRGAPGGLGETALPLRGAPGGRALPVGTPRRGVRGGLGETALPLEVWVEPGVQTANDATLKRINRGHDWECSKKAIPALAQRGILAAPHMIIGLPGETAKDWNRTAEKLAAVPIAGIKIHNLHLVRGTPLAEEYANAPFPLLSHYDYAEALMEFLRRIPPDIPVMRISTDTPDEERIAPHWHLEKGQFLDYVVQQMTMREITQGDLRNDGIKERWNNENPNIPTFQHSNIPVITDDGSITFFSEDWKEHYHDKAGARLEAQKKYVEPSGLAAKLKTSNLNLLDVCFGLGTNTLAALRAQRADRSVCSTCAADTPVCHSLDITALEMDKRVVRAAAEHFQCLETDPVDWKNVLCNLLQHSTFHIPQFTISIRWGDARFRIQHLADESFDIIFHDPFSSQHCPELWTVEFFQQLRRVMKPDGILLTYSSALPVRGALREAGFLIAETHPGRRMSNGTAAAKTGAALAGFEAIGAPDPRRSIPYRDPHLCAPSKTILRMRQDAIEAFSPSLPPPSSAG